MNNMFEFINEERESVKNNLFERISFLENRVSELEAKERARSTKKILEEAEKATPKPCHFCKRREASPVFKCGLDFIFLCKSCNDKRINLFGLKSISDN